MAAAAEARSLIWLDITMPTFKGNKGKLLQHWVLTELTLLLQSQFPFAPLSLIDAHAMSPYATRSPGTSANLFDAVRGGLPGARCTKADAGIR